ncbi:hypothetical protein N0V88_005518 [Collariella sp. IMI 366227]|nr:hypothetical protein N0V88_005518 [Collariella sp. IMI 366227]
MADKYLLRVTAGPSYDPTTHSLVPVNSPEQDQLVHISSPLVDAHLCRKPTTNPSSQPLPNGVPATDLQFGNDFDHPIRDRLPPGFGTAMNIVKWWIDPGLEGDPYADNPYLYGPALSSFNTVYVGEGEHDPSKGGLWFEEGGDERGMAWRRDVVGAPDEGKARMKWALKAGNKERHHRKRSHQLRYVLRNRSTGQVYLVVLFTLHLKEDVNEDGTLKPAALAAVAQASGGKGGKMPKIGSEPELELEPDEEDFSEEEALGEARRKLSEVDLNGAGGTGDDDVD